DLLNLSATGAWALNVTGTAGANYVNVAYSNASGGTQVDAAGGTSTDGGNNTNWDFDNGARYWVGATTGNTANWNTVNSWAYTSGGASGAPVPGATNVVYFDGAGGKVGGCTLDAAVSVASLTIGAGYAGAGGNDGSISAAGNTITVAGALNMSGGLITAASNNLAITAHTISQDAGSITTATSGTITINSSGTGGSFALGTVTAVGSVTVGNTAAPASVTLNGAVTSSASTVSLYSNGGITQNGAISANSGNSDASFYPDRDNNSATSAFTHTSGTTTATNTYFYFPASSVTAFTLAGLDSSAGTTNDIYIGGAATNAPASVTVTGSMTGNAVVYVRALGDITQNADIIAGSGSTDVIFYPDADNTGTGSFTRTSGTITANNTYFYFPASSITAFTLEGLDASAGSTNAINVGTASNNSPASVTLSGTVINNESIYIRSLGDITQNGGITANAGAGIVNFYPDMDNNSATSTFTHTSGTITANNTYFYFPASATTAFTLAGLDASAGTTNNIDVGVAAGTSPASVNITGTLTGNNAISIRSSGNITQNGAITANAGAGSVYFFPDNDNNSATSAFTHTSGTITADNTYFYFPASSTTAFTLEGLDASAGTTNTIYVGTASTNSPASATLSGAVTGNDSMYIRSLGDITQNGDI
ncbi:MAG: hypothetical protein AAB728_00155, partial [Patescibacteria group bacterium]